MRRERAFVIGLQVIDGGGPEMKVREMSPIGGVSEWVSGDIT